MPRFKLFRKSSKMVGLPPGTLVHIGEKVTAKVKIRVLDYDEAHFQEKEVKTIEECFPFKDTPTVTWINIDGVHQADIIEKIGKHFDVHPLILEDIMNTEQRPKIEDFENYLFIVLKMLYQDDKNNEINIEQVSLIVGSNYVISFQEREGDVFNPIRDRIRTSKGRVRRMGPDYLAYALIDAIVDNYFIVLEKLGDKIEDVEEVLITEPSTKTLKSIHTLKRKLLFLRRSVWPLREVINVLERGECSLVKKATIIFLRDVYDHTIQVMETTEIYREMLSEMIDAHLSSISNKTNEIVKVLTIIATIFIPLTFIASIYGMNFTWMPEIEWPEGYHMVLIVMMIVGAIMLIYFRRKKWL
ncbi:MAG: magnesium/cobalt transporter CorA [Candidatus Jordarchaeum sp.]|uniref:magnesium/cobalt transporter CorA n=1 Tax=Candidatus Jordarchaeum sp. TaxID=2823881 RepID=UPI004049ED3C